MTARIINSPRASVLHGFLPIEPFRLKALVERTMVGGRIIYPQAQGKTRAGERKNKMFQAQKTVFPWPST